jgi:hypothetical protein
MVTSPVERITEALWAAFRAADNCFVDEAMDVIDTGGNYESFRMEQVAAHLVQALGLQPEIGVSEEPDDDWELEPSAWRDDDDEGRDWANGCVAKRLVSPWVGLQP